MKKLCYIVCCLLIGLALFTNNAKYNTNIANTKQTQEKEEEALATQFINADTYSNSFFEANVQILAMVCPVKILERPCRGNIFLNTYWQTTSIRYMQNIPLVCKNVLNHFYVVRQVTGYYLYTLQRLII